MPSSTSLPVRDRRAKLIMPAIDAQTIIDNADEGDVLEFAPGIHELGISRNRACLYLDKSLQIVIPAGATLRLADGEGGWEQTNPPNDTQGANGVEMFNVYTWVPFRNDMQCRAINGVVSSGVNKIIRISSAGTPDQFRVRTSANQSTSAFSAVETSPVNITGGWQNIGDNIEVRFTSTTGHAVEDQWWIGTGGEACYMIRVGTGFHETPIEGVEIVGEGTIDCNKAGQIVPNILAAEISAGVLLDGRVNDTLVRGLNIINGERPVMAYGRHSGTFRPYGLTGPGSTYNINRLRVEGIRTRDCEGAILFGHPAKRGRQNECSVVNCWLHTENGPAVEPNYRTIGWQVEGCWFEVPPTQSAVHTWRGGSSGRVSDSFLVDNTSGSFLLTTTPSGWPVATAVSESGNTRVTTQDTSPVVAANSYGDLIAALNPISHYTLDDTDNVAASYNNNRPGMHSNVTRGSSAVVVSGGNSCTYVAASSSFTQIDGILTNPSFLEIWFWLNLTSISGSQVVFGHRNGGNALIQVTLNSATSISLQWRNSAGGTVNSLTATVSNLVGTNNFICCRWSNGSQRIWQNNVEVASATNAVSGDYTATRQSLGATFTVTDTPSVFLNGRLDEVSLFASAPSDANRLAAYDLGS